MAKKIIRPIKGIDVDSSLNRRDDNSLFMSKNLRPNNIGTNITGEYSNIKGTNRISSVNAIVLKICKVGSNIVVFLKDESIADMNYICLIQESDIPKNGDSEITVNYNYTYWTGGYNGNLIIDGDFGFDVNNEIHVKTYYESESVQKIYWSTEGQPLRGLNIIYSVSSNNIPTYRPQDLETIPSSELEAILINKTISGNLSTGKIFYTYTLTNNNGAETQLAPLSVGYHLTKPSEESSNDYNYKGYGIDVDSNKGINFTISNVPTKFTKAKIYSIHYVDNTSLPVVKLIYDGSIVSSLSVNDTGIALLNIDPEEFLSFNNALIKDGNLEIKNNRLFVSNYSEDFFDIDEYASGGYWDARAYRFLYNGGDARIFDQDLISYIDINGTTPNYSIQTTHDCVNKSNDINNWDGSNIQNNYIYRKGSTSYGATGLNVQIFQSVSGNLGPDYSDEVIRHFAKKTNEVYYAEPDPNNGYSSFANPYLAANLRSFKFNEVYRIGIQFINSKSQLSFPKWICDYKYISQTYYSYTGDTGENASDVKLLMSLGALSITVDNIPVDENGDKFKWRIVYVPLTEDDESVHWGMFNNLFKHTGTSNYLALYNRYYSETRTGDIWGSPTITNDGKYLEFINPDYCFGNRKTYSHVEFSKYGYSPTIIGDFHSFFNASVHKMYPTDNASGMAAINSTFKSITSQYDVEYSQDISGQVQLSSSDKLDRAGYTITRLTTGTIDGKHYVYGKSNKGRCQIIQPSSTTGAGISGNIYIYGCAFVDNFQSRYGGFSYDARQGNGYIKLSDFTDTEGSAVKVYGDSYFGVFEYLRQISDNSNSFIDSEIPDSPGAWSDYNAPGTPEVLVIPYISRINCNLRSDDMFTKVYRSTGSYMLHEYSGIYENIDARVNPYEYIYTQQNDLYLYNRTYSIEQNLVKFYEKQTSNSLTEDFNLRILASNKKSLNEKIDSFMKFAGTSYIDVDGQYGKINGMIVFNDKLFFFQDRAIGIASVNEQAVTNANNGSQLSLGEVGLLSRYDYITVENGISDINHIVKTNSALYIVDAVRKEILRIKDGIEKISMTKNISSIVKSYFINEAKIVYNRKYNEILFFIRENEADTDDIVLVFNELTDSFTGIQNQYAKLRNSIKLDRSDFIDEIIVNDQNELYTLNDGDYNKFGPNFNVSEITYLITSGQENIVLFNVLEFIVRQIDSNNDIVPFIDKIRVYNDIVDTGELAFSDACKLDFGKYRTSKLRNYTVNSRERINSDHIYVTLKTTENWYSYNIPQNYRVFFRDLIASYTEYNYFG